MSKSRAHLRKIIPCMLGDTTEKTKLRKVVDNSSIFDSVTQFIYLSTMEMNVRIIEEFNNRGRSSSS